LRSSTHSGETSDGNNSSKDTMHRANATEFGLAAAVLTRDVDRARRVSR
jgi:betaine-aldehyde dehydrogenase